MALEVFFGNVFITIKETPRIFNLANYTEHGQYQIGDTNMLDIWSGITRMDIPIEICLIKFAFKNIQIP